MAIYWRQPRAATPREMDLAELLSDTASIILARHSEAEARRRAEEALRESNERLGKLVALMPGAMYTCDRDGRLTFFNRRAVELWGREPATENGQDRFCGSRKLWTRRCAGET